MHEVRNLCERAILGDVGRLPSAVALAAVPTVVVVGKEHASTTRRHHGALTAQPGDLAVLINLGLVRSHRDEDRIIKSDDESTNW